MNDKTQVKPKAGEQPKPEEAKDVALRTTGTSLATADFGEDAGAGMENVDASELRIPFLYILDAKSPQCKPVAQGGVAGAQQGMLINTGTGEIYDGDAAGGVTFVPVHRDHNFVEFTPMNLGGGLVAIYPPDDPKILEMRAKQGKFGKLYSVFPPKRDAQGNITEGTEIGETFYLYGLIVDANGGTAGVIVPFKSTQIKKYQAFMQRQTSFKYANPKSTDENPLPPVQPPIFAHRWHLSSQPESKKTFSWQGWTLTLDAKEPDGRESPYFKSLIPSGSQLYADAKRFRDMIVGGAAKADFKAQTVDDEVKDEVPM